MVRHVRLAALLISPILEYVFTRYFNRDFSESVVLANFVSYAPTFYAIK